jgi:hypothetical protein
MGILKDLGELLEKIPLWKEFKTLPDRVKALEAQLAALQSDTPPLKLPDAYQFDKRTGTLFNAESYARICSSCYYSEQQRETPLQEYDWGWECPKCEKKYGNPNWKDPSVSKTDWDPYER